MRSSSIKTKGRESSVQRIRTILSHCGHLSKPPPSRLIHRSSNGFLGPACFASGIGRSFAPVLEWQQWVEVRRSRFEWKGAAIERPPRTPRRPARCFQQLRARMRTAVRPARNTCKAEGALSPLLVHRLLSRRIRQRQSTYPVACRSCREFTGVANVRNGSKAAISLADRQTGPAAADGLVLGQVTSLDSASLRINKPDRTIRFHNGLKAPHRVRFVELSDSSSVRRGGRLIAA